MTRTSAGGCSAPWRSRRRPDAAGSRTAVAQGRDRDEPRRAAPPHRRCAPPSPGQAAGRGRAGPAGPAAPKAKPASSGPARRRLRARQPGPPGQHRRGRDHDRGHDAGLEATAREPGGSPSTRWSTQSRAPPTPPPPGPPAGAAGRRTASHSGDRHRRHRGAGPVVERTGDSRPPGAARRSVASQHRVAGDADRGSRHQSSSTAASTATGTGCQRIARSVGRSSSASCLPRTAPADRHGSCGSRPPARRHLRAAPMANGSQRHRAHRQQRAAAARAQSASR